MSGAIVKALVQIASRPCAYANSAKVHPAFKCPPACEGEIDHVVRDYFIPRQPHGDRDLWLCSVHGPWYAQTHANVRRLRTTRARFVPPTAVTP